MRVVVVLTAQAVSVCGAMGIQVLAADADGDAADWINALDRFSVEDGD
jgi:hypothetical protein